MERPVTRRTVLGSLGATVLAGCTDSGTGGRDPVDGGSAGRSRGSAATDGTSPPTTAERLPLPMDPSSVRSEAVSGGPPKDGIPSIDDPNFVSADDAPWLDQGDPVFGLATDGGAKAYPQSILVRHEVCNDVVDGQPVSVTYCPLTGTAMGFERGETTFGVSGRLVNNNLIMYDRGTETWWPQVLATAIPGPWNDSPAMRSLREFRLVWTTWKRWSNRHPGTEVLSRDTGFAKNYNQDPYGSYNPRKGYYSPGSPPMFTSFSDDDRLTPKTVVLGTRTPDGAAAFEKDALRERGLVDGELGEMAVLAVHEPDLDTGYVYRNPEGRRFDYRDGQVIDDSGTAHPPEELPLDRTLAFDAMWFAWSGFYPETTLYV
jgi:hypothetical protein